MSREGALIAGALAVLFGLVVGYLIQGRWAEASVIATVGATSCFFSLLGLRRRRGR